MVKIPVVLNFDSRIILGASVTILSLLDCAKDNTVYDFRIFHSDIDKKDQKALQALIENTRHKMQFHYIDETQFEGAPHNNGSWRLNVYYRLLTPEILTEYDKAIYTDVDVLFKKDLQEVFATDLTGYEIAAVPTCTTASIKINHPIRYFEENKNEKNYISSFIIFNNKLMREEKTVAKTFETIKNFGDRLVFFDMDCMNLTYTRIKDVPLEYCVFESMYEYTDIKKIAEYKALSSLYTDEELYKTAENPALIHYAGQLGKPWHRKIIPDYYQEYIDRLPKNLVKYTTRDLRKKFLSKTKYPIQHFDVGLVNYYHTQNYGACLTAYALQEVIKELGYTCAFVNEFRVKKKYRLSFGKRFVNRYLRQMPKFNNIKRAGNLADIYITGSDQVFRPAYLKKKKERDKYLLNFVNKDSKKIAFSASYGIGEEEFATSKKHIIKDLKKALQTFDYVSTRENSGVNICKNTMEVNSEQILDPVFLLDKKRFIDLAEKSDKKYKNKIVTYVLDKNPVYEEFYKELNKKYGIEICHLAKSDLSVEDWLKAYIEADYIVTDSFHGTCFALIFGKPFISIVNKKRGKTRFETLSEMFDLKEPFAESLEHIKDFEFCKFDKSKIDKIIANKKEYALSVLKRELLHKKNDFITKNCTGCGACFNACPKGAIEMVENFEGFLYPKVNSKKCVNCGLCQKVCPTNTKQKNQNSSVPKCYAVMAKDEIRFSGVSSGGASMVMMEQMIKDGGYVVGACYNDQWRVVHSVADSADGIKKFKGSKYFQSNTGEIYKQVQSLLKSDKKVLFAGTPCQIAGLKSFLKEDYTNLITVDIVCHGVPSYKTFEMFTENMIQDKEEKILGINFRDKKYGWGPKLCFSAITTATTYEIPSKSSSFMMAFLRNFSIRKSCFTCPFQKTPRQGDITIGDFWRVHKYKDSLDDKKGTSLLLANNKKGQDFFERIKNNFKLVEKVPYKYAVKGNKTLVKPTKFNPNRDRFMLTVNKDNFNKLLKEYLGKKFEGGK